MKDFVVTKKQIIKALKTEPLGARGAYVAHIARPETMASRMTKSCVFCAVGAALHGNGVRRAKDICGIGAENATSPVFFEDNYGRDISDTDAYHKAAEKAKRSPMSGLSSFYEHQIRRHALEEVRAACIDFVQQNFPAKVEIDAQYA